MHLGSPRSYRNIETGGLKGLHNLLQVGPKPLENFLVIRGIAGVDFKNVNLAIPVKPGDGFLRLKFSLDRSIQPAAICS